MHISDGSSFHPVQVVAPNTLPNYADEVLRLTAGCAVAATGMVVPSPAKGQPFEMQANAIEVVGWVDDPGDLSDPAQAAHLGVSCARWPICGRAPTSSARRRGCGTRSQRPIHRFFDENGFFWVNTPIITASDAEGAGALFRVSALDLANLPRTTTAGSISPRISLAAKRF